jgi:hypothetical protein
MYRKIAIVVTLFLALPGAIALEHTIDQRTAAAPEYDNFAVSGPLTGMQGAAERAVLAELLSTTLCPNCPRAEHTLSDLCETGEYPFHFVTLVIDRQPVVSQVAVKRARWLSAAYIPMLYLDGGYTVEGAVDRYGAAINFLAQRDSHDVGIDVATEWLGNAKISITVTVTDHEASNYLGHLQVYVTEIASRWHDSDGVSIPHALLDYALNTYVFIPAGETYSKTTTFDGTMHRNPNGDTYADIAPENIHIVASVAHLQPHLQKNP